MPEKPSEPNDVADLLDSLAERARDTAADAAVGALTITPPAELLDEGPSLGALDVFTDAEAVTVTVETRNADAAGVHVSILAGRLLIGLGDGAYRRDLPLPVAVDEEKAVATFRNGVLDVVLPIKRR